jgi:hypothetical protein
MLLSHWGAHFMGAVNHQAVAQPLERLLLVIFMSLAMEWCNTCNLTNSHQRSPLTICLTTVAKIYKKAFVSKYSD